MILRDILEGVGLHSTHALAVHQHLGYGVALIRGDGEGLVSAVTDGGPAGGRDGAVRAGRCLNGVVGVVPTATTAAGLVIQLNGAGQRRVVGAVVGGKDPFVELVGLHGGGGGQIRTRRIIHPLDCAGDGEVAACSGQASLRQRLTAGGDSSVLGCAGGGRSGDVDLHLCAGDAVVACIASLGGRHLYGTDLNGSQLAGGVNGCLAGAVGHSVGHSPGAGAAAGAQLQGLTVDHGGTTGEGQSRLVVLCREGNDHIDGGICIVVGADGHGQGDGITSHTAGEGVGHLSGGIHSPAVNRHRTGLALGALGVGQCACVSGHHRADCLLAGGRGELLADRDICQREGSCLGDVHHDGGDAGGLFLQPVVVLISAAQRNAGDGNCLAVACIGIGHRTLGVGQVNSHSIAGNNAGDRAAGESNLKVILCIGAVGGSNAGNGNFLCRDLRVGNIQHLGNCQPIVAGGDGSRGKGDLIRLVDIGAIVFQRAGDSEGVAAYQRAGLHRNGKTSGRAVAAIVGLGDRAGVDQIRLGQRLGGHIYGAGDNNHIGISCAADDAGIDQLIGLAIACIGLAGGPQGEVALVSIAIRANLGGDGHAGLLLHDVAPVVAIDGVGLNG